MPIKNGQYGTYYEWTDNGTVKRVSLQTIPDWTPYKKNFKKSELELTEEDCAKLVAGEKVEIKKSFSEGYKIISCELTSYEDKRDGTPRYSIKATTVQEVFDKNIIQDAIKAGKFQIEGTKLAVIKENLEAQLKELELGNPKWEISYSEQEIAEKEIRVVYLYCSKSPDKTLTYGISNYGSSNISWYLKFDMEYNLIEQITDDEYGDLCLQHRLYAQKLREEQAEKARKEKEQKELEEKEFTGTATTDTWKKYVAGTVLPSSAVTLMSVPSYVFMNFSVSYPHTSSCLMLLSCVSLPSF